MVVFSDGGVRAIHVLPPGQCGSIAPVDPVDHSTIDSVARLIVQQSEKVFRSFVRAHLGRKPHDRAAATLH